MFINYNKDYIEIKERLANGNKVIPSIAVKIFDNIKDGSIFDKRLSHYHGWINLPKGIINIFHLVMKYNIPKTEQKDILPALRELLNNNTITKTELSKYISDGNTGILLPKGINNLASIPSGFEYLTKIQKAAYRVIANISSYHYLINVDADDASINRLISDISNSVYLYYEALANELTGKNGLMRKIMTPRQDYTCHGVACNRIDIPLHKVIIPRKAVKKWCKSDNFRKAYNISDDYNLLNNNEFDRLFANAKCMLIGMPDHNFPCIFSMEIELWSSSGVGVNPAIAKTMGRDFDGDLLYIKMFIGEESIKEMNIFNATNHINDIKSALNKSLKNVDKNVDNIKDLDINILKVHKATKYESTSLKHAQELEELNETQIERFKSLVKGMDSNEINKLSMQSALDFNTIKYGTADGGDMGNMLRTITSANKDRSKLLDANNTYHIIAQSALDAKHGHSAIINDIHAILRDGNCDTIEELVEDMSKLGMDKTSIKLISDIMFDTVTRGRKYISLTQLLKSKYPTGSVIRGDVKSLFSTGKEETYIGNMWKLTPDNNNPDLYIKSIQEYEIEVIE